eukprot:5056982-Amphidinium_carterae.4
MKKEISAFSWHAQIQCEHDAELLDFSRAAEALKLLMISAVETGDVKDFFVRCYAITIEQSKRTKLKVADPFGRSRSAVEHVKMHPQVLEEEKKRFPRRTFESTPPQREGSIPPRAPRASSGEPRQNCAEGRARGFRRVPYHHQALYRRQRRRDHL